MTGNPLAGRDLISIRDLSKPEIVFLLDTADRFRQAVGRDRRLDLLSGYLLAALFYEPSTRTRLSFEAAMHRLGGQVLSVADARAASSAAKGESVADAARIIGGYADIIVQRHPVPGSARQAADATDVPVINGGDGTEEHPTQALLDLYTIQEQKGTLDGLTVALAGDLKHGRTVHSLALALTRWESNLLLISPPELAMDVALLAELRALGANLEETGELQEQLDRIDVLYLTRIQRERFSDAQEYERLKGSYRVDRAVLSGARDDLTVMHPLPRVDEIAPEVDALPNAAYFRQAVNGVWVRMALLALLLDRTL